MNACHLSRSIKINDSRMACSIYVTIYVKDGRKLEMGRKKLWEIEAYKSTCYSISSPFTATSLTSRLSCSAINPIIPNTTNPANTLVPQLSRVTSIASLQRKVSSSEEHNKGPALCLLLTTVVKIPKSKPDTNIHLFSFYFLLIWSASSWNDRCDTILDMCTDEVDWHAWQYSKYLRALLWNLL